MFKQFVDIRGISNKTRRTTMGVLRIIRRNRRNSVLVALALTCVLATYMTAKQMVIHEATPLQLVYNRVMGELPEPPKSQENHGPRKLHSLVDLPRNLNFEKRQSNADLLTILWFNKPPWVDPHDFLESCEYNNCLVTLEKAMITNVSAVIYSPSHQGMGNEPPVNPEERNPNQAWVFYSLEPPYNFYFPDYKGEAWLNTMNWSMTYRLDSDVPAPYGRIVKKSDVPERDYEEIFSRKTKVAAIVVSHCLTKGKREEYVDQLKQLGLDVDVLGKCGKRIADTDNEDFLKVINSYKFLLAFENSICNDYITEKLFAKYNLDLLLVVRGGARYSEIIPGIPFIDTAKFHNKTELVSYLNKLGDDKEKYIELLKRKDQFEGEGEGKFAYPYAMCELCRKLNHLSDNRNRIRSMYDYLNDQQCKTPRDLDE